MTSLLAQRDLVPFRDSPVVWGRDYVVHVASRCQACALQRYIGLVHCHNYAWFVLLECAH